MIILRPCALCAHYKRGGSCTAYPRGIPLPLLSGDIDHLSPVEGDNGIRFEPAREGERERYAALFDPAELPRLPAPKSVV